MNLLLAILLLLTVVISMGWALALCLLLDYIDAAYADQADEGPERNRKQQTAKGAQRSMRGLDRMKRAA